MGEFLLGSQGNRVQWLRLSDLGFPGGPVVKNLPANAGDTCLISLCSKILHALEQLSPGATNTKAHILETVLCNKGTISRRNPHAAMKSSPVRSKWRKQGFTEQRRPSAAKINWFKKKKCSGLRQTWVWIPALANHKWAASGKSHTISNI